jgi:hypothetical protein
MLRTRNCIRIHVARRGQLGLSADLLAKFLYLWTGKYNGDNLLSDLSSDEITVTSKDWTSRYIDSSSSSTFAVPIGTTYLNADGSDDFWYNISDVRQQRTLADLIGYDPQRTFIKYADFDPFHVYAIGILKTGETLTDDDKNKLSHFFKLHMFYFGVLNDHGYMKDNVGFEQRDTGP